MTPPPNCLGHHVDRETGETISACADCWSSYQWTLDLFERQHRRTEEADEFWRKEHGQPDTIPDLGELVEWLMKKAGLKP